MGGITGASVPALTLESPLQGHLLQDELDGWKLCFYPTLGNSLVSQGTARSARKLEELGKTDS